MRANPFSSHAARWQPSGVILAETVAIDGNVLLLVMAVLIAVLALWIFSACIGFRYARAAGWGEDGAMRRWVVAGSLQVLLVVYTPLVVVALVVLGLQVHQYRLAKADGAGPGNGHAGGWSGGPSSR